MAKTSWSFESGGDASRLRTLAKYQIVGTAPEPRFDRIARFAAKLFNAPLAYISLVEKDRQWFKAHVGDGASETPRDISFCTHAIMRDEPLVVLDAARDERFAKSPLVTQSPSIRFYAGAPLIASDGHRLGALCVADRRPRTFFTQEERDRLAELAAMAFDQMDLRRVELARLAMNEFRRIRDEAA